MNKFVLDASAFLAMINNENGKEIVIKLLKNSIMSSVNVSEVVSKLVEKFNMPEQDIELLLKLGFEEIPFDHEQAVKSGMLKKIAKEYGLSLGDRACLALATIKKLPVLTADKTWTKLKLDLEIKQIR